METPKAAEGSRPRTTIRRPKFIPFFSIETLFAHARLMLVSRLHDFEKSDAARAGRAGASEKNIKRIKFHLGTSYHRGGSAVPKTISQNNGQYQNLAAYPIKKVCNVMGTFVTIYRYGACAANDSEIRPASAIPMRSAGEDLAANRPREN